MKNYTDKELAMAIKNSTEWDFDLLTELCNRANMSDEWDTADSENFERLAEVAAEKLNVEIY